MLEYDSPLTSPSANLVFGQPNFTSNGCTAGATGLCQPASVAVDAAGHLYVADTTNNRVLEYDTPLSSQLPSRVFGQGGSFTSNSCNQGSANPGAGTLCDPVGVAVDSSSRLYIADGNNRVLEYDAPLTSQTATHVIGQPGFITNDCVVSATGLCFPGGIVIDASGALLVADAGNARVVEYDNPLTSPAASHVFGQAGSFNTRTCNNGGISATSLCLIGDGLPFGAALPSILLAGSSPATHSTVVRSSTCRSSRWVESRRHRISRDRSLMRHPARL